MADILEITDEEFEAEVKQSEMPVLVDFWATWCTPCQMVAPRVESVGRQLAGQLKVVKVDVGEYQRMAQEYNITSIPALLFFKKGEVVERLVGVQPENVLLEKARQVIEG